MKDINTHQKYLLSPEDIRTFQAGVYTYYEQNGRDLPWRKTKNPYNIFVSEIMLQQTQVERVIEKYERFISIFPDFPTLADASLKDILLAWQGLGYNRRALMLKQAARTIMAEYKGEIPSRVEDLVKLSGLGRTTASSILAFAFNQPVVFIETNIRRVYIHHFFEGQENINDRDIIPLVEATLDTSNPAVWYHALMDYGAMLKKKVTNPNRRSVHYKRQPPFENSDRQIRGAILRILLEKSPISCDEILEILGVNKTRCENILLQLKKEKLVKQRKGKYSIG
jgi:A/G-specific adenine glycosylase